MATLRKCWKQLAGTNLAPPRSTGSSGLQNTMGRVCIQVHIYIYIYICIYDENICVYIHTHFYIYIYIHVLHLCMYTHILPTAVRGILSGPSTRAQHECSRGICIPQGLNGGSMGLSIRGLDSVAPFITTPHGMPARQAPKKCISTYKSSTNKTSILLVYQHPPAAL